MKIIEQFTLSKTGNMEDNADGIFTGKNFIAVIDGVTSKNSSKSNISTKIICETLLELDNVHTTFEEIINTINEKLQDYNDVNDKVSATMAIYIQNDNTVYIIGDCRAKIIGHYGSYDAYGRGCEFEKNLCYVRNLYNDICLKSGKSLADVIEKDYGRQLIMPILEHENVYANKNNSNCDYAVLNGETIPEELIKLFYCGGYKELILASDGYKSITNTLAETEEIYTSELDVLGTGYTKMPKPYADDRTYVRILL